MDKKTRKTARRQIWLTHKLLGKNLTPNKTLHRLRTQNMGSNRISTAGGLLFSQRVHSG